MPVATCSPSAANSRRICATTAAARCASTAANARRALDDTVDVTSTTVSATAALTSANSRLRSDMRLGSHARVWRRGLDPEAREIPPAGRGDGAPVPRFDAPAEAVQLRHAQHRNDDRCLEQGAFEPQHRIERDRKSTRLNSSHITISYAV